MMMCVMLSYCKRHVHELTRVCTFLILPYTDLSLHRHRQHRVEQLHVRINFLFLVLCIPQDWLSSFCQMLRGFLFLASVGPLLAVGYAAKVGFGRAVGSFAQSVVLIYFLFCCLVIPVFHRLVSLQNTMTSGPLRASRACAGPRDAVSERRNLGQPNSAADRRRQHNDRIDPHCSRDRDHYWHDHVCLSQSPSVADSLLDQRV
jgi:hypothetical protein